MLSSACKPIEPTVYEWNTPFPIIGTQSSPRCADLTGDGILDVVIGAGMNEYLSCDQGVIALDGKSGQLLWTVLSTDQIVGSPIFVDINLDGTQDVVIGGRSHNLMAIDGSVGKVLWRYTIQSDSTDPRAYARYNFFNCQLMLDCNGDGVKDILAANGGNPRALPNTLDQRHPGTLMILDSRSGQIIAIDTMPDGLENYCSPVIQQVNTKDYVLFGTGGETFGGNFYKVPVEDLKQSDLSRSKQLLHNDGQGFIAPPTLIDLNEDGVREIVIVSHDAHIYCLDGLSDSVLWTLYLPKMETNNMLVPGHFNQDSIFDFFGFFTQGSWPANEGIVELVINGLNGEIMGMDSIGDTGFSSPVTFQADQDDQDEVLIHINYAEINSLRYDKNKSQLIFYDFPGFKRIPFDTAVQFKNISTTPWIGDLDHDGRLDIITCFLLNTYKIDHVGGMFISRLRTPWYTKKAPIGGAYMNYNGSSWFN